MRGGISKISVTQQPFDRFFSFFFFFLQERKIFESNSESNSSANITVLCNLVPYQPRRGFANLANVIYLTAYFRSRLPRNKATERHYSRGTIRTHASSRSLSLLLFPRTGFILFLPSCSIFQRNIEPVVLYPLQNGNGNENGKRVGQNEVSKQRAILTLPVKYLNTIIDININVINVYTAIYILDLE